MKLNRPRTVLEQGMENLQFLTVSNDGNHHDAFTLIEVNIQIV
jgi:hypothetical protein